MLSCFIFYWLDEMLIWQTQPRRLVTFMGVLSQIQLSLMRLIAASLISLAKNQIEYNRIGYFT